MDICYKDDSMDGRRIRAKDGTNLGSVDGGVLIGNINTKDYYGELAEMGFAVPKQPKPEGELDGTNGEG